MYAQAPGMILRHPLETRPPSVKEADNKVVAWALHFCISPAIGDAATPRVFIHGRVLSQSAVDLDSTMFGNDPYCFTWDGKLLATPGAVPLCFALPSAAHAWMFSTIQKNRFPFRINYLTNYFR